MAWEPKRTLAVGGGVAILLALFFVVDRGPGDTPVVLIGDSLQIKAGPRGHNGNWSTVTDGDEYSTDSGNLPETIGRKKKGDDGSGDLDSSSYGPTRSLAAWTVYLSIKSPSDSSVSTVVAHLQQKGKPTELHLIREQDAGGKLCLQGDIITYHPDGNCQGSDTVKFSEIGIALGSNAPLPLECKDDRATAGQCVFVFVKPRKHF